MNIVILEQISDLNLFIACDVFVVSFAKAFWNLFILRHSLLIHSDLFILIWIDKFQFRYHLPY